MSDPIKETALPLEISHYALLSLRRRPRRLRRSGRLIRRLIEHIMTKVLRSYNGEITINS